MHKFFTMLLLFLLFTEPILANEFISPTLTTPATYTEPFEEPSSFPPSTFINFTQPLPLGELNIAPTVLNFYGAQIELFESLDSYYVPVSSLKKAGYSVSYFTDTGEIHIFSPRNRPQDLSHLASIDLFLEDPSYKLYTNSIYLDGVKTYGLTSSDRTFIPLESLSSACEMNLSSRFMYTLILKEDSYALATPTSIQNPTDSALTLYVTDLYWGKDGLVRLSSTYELEPFQVLTREPMQTETTSGEILQTETTQIETTQSELIQMEIIQESPAKDPAPFYITTLFTLSPSSQKSSLELSAEKLFSHASLTQSKALYEQAQMKEKEKEKEKLLETTSTYGDPLTLQELLEVEEKINLEEISSSTPYLVWTDLSSQKTYIFEGSTHEWALIKHFVCSTGKSSTPTPKGTFSLTQKVPFFGVDKGYMCKNAFGFIGTKYLYHSIIFDKTGSYLLEGKGVLGKPASDGCIRFSTENSEWFYEHMLSGTTVWIN